MGYDRGGYRIGPSSHPAWQRVAAVAPLYVAALLLRYFVLSVGVFWAKAALYPYGLENGEGFVLADAVLGEHTLQRIEEHLKDRANPATDEYSDDSD